MYQGDAGVEADLGEGQIGRELLTGGVTVILRIYKTCPQHLRCRNTASLLQPIPVWVHWGGIVMDSSGRRLKCWYNKGYS